MVDNRAPAGNFLLLSALSTELDEDMGIEEEEMPTHLNPINSSGGFNVVSTDKLSLRYTNSPLHGHDVGVVQANCPAPFKKLAYYFEMFVKSAGQKGTVAIGFTCEYFKMRRQPGWEINSYGYHGDDGLLYRGHGKGEAFGPTFTTGDTVGGGINYATQEVFFTKNGKLVGTAHKDVKSPLYPTIAVHSQNEEVVVNFGLQPFAFDIKGYVMEERHKQQMLIERESLPLNLSHSIVRSYLLHYGYQETLNSFDAASKTTLTSTPVVQENGFTELGKTYALNHRKILRQLIRNGDIDSAFDKLREWYPQLLQNDRTAIYFMLHRQKFIELVRVGNLEAAVCYGRSTLARFFGDSRLEGFLQDCIALLAYEQPQKSPVGHLLDGAQREIIADAVNTMVLSTNPIQKEPRDYVHSQLENLLRQLTACCLERRKLNGDQGEAFNMHRALNNGNNHKRR